MGSAEHAAFVPRQRVANVMAAATRANLDSAARHAASARDTAAPEDPTETPAYQQATTTTVTTVPDSGPAPVAAAQNPVGPEVPPNPVSPTQIDAP